MSFEYKKGKDSGKRGNGSFLTALRVPKGKGEKPTWGELSTQ